MSFVLIYTSPEKLMRGLNDICIKRSRPRYWR